MTYSVEQEQAVLGGLPPELLLDQLNPEQRDAVETVEGPLLVLAGAGTGKTKVLTTRIAHLLLNKFAYPGQILAVTFTNKAAREMAERVRGMTGMQQSLWLGTFHSIAARILRRHAELVGLTQNFTILDDDDQLRLVKAALAERNIDEKANPPKLMHAVIQGWKDRGLAPEKLNGAEANKGGGAALGVYRHYQARLKQLNAVDFGDLLLHNLTLFAEHTDILAEYSRRFHYILVDEYQDTNVAQYLWLRLLALGHRNLCCVGDDDQSIYSWRGAEVGNILRFEKDFEGAKVIRLERNYRSTGHILAAASGLIAKNRDRLGKTLRSESEEGEKVRLKSVWDDAEEARFVAGEIEALQRAGASLNQMAILVRAGFQTRAFEERFLSMAIPYRVIGGLRFYERLEIRDAIAYLRVIHEPADSMAFERIINTPRRGVGQATVQLLHSTARERGVSLHAATQTLLESGGIKGKLGASLGALVASFARWREAMQTLPLGEVLELVLEESGYRAMWQAEKSPDAQGRLENLRELARAIGEFETVGDFLDHVGLVMDREGGEQGDMVSLMTLHAAKGLEFDTVFLPGWEEGLFPHQRALDESGAKGLEEERRLAHVGMTRARKTLFIVNAASRRIFNQWQSSIPSRFLGEIPAAHVERLPGGAGQRPAGGVMNWQQDVAKIMTGLRPSSETPKAEGLREGQRVFHVKFGYGRIQGIHGGHLDILFEKAGQKKVLADFVEKADER